MKKIKMASILVAVITAFGVYTSQVSAALEKEAPAEGTVTFIPGDGATKPQDPDHPGEELEEPGGTGMEGPLTIDIVPILDFGIQKISGNTEFYEAKAQEIKRKNALDYEYVANYVQVTDNRGLSVPGGWTLTVTQTQQFTNITNGTTNVLNGAKIHFKNGTLKTLNPLDEVVSELTLGAAQLVMGAALGQGAGTSIEQFGATADLTSDKLNPSILLEVPGTTAKVAGEYTAVIVWTLNDTPYA